MRIFQTMDTEENAEDGGQGGGGGRSKKLKEANIIDMFAKKRPR